MPTDCKHVWVRKHPENKVSDIHCGLCSCLPPPPSITEPSRSYVVRIQQESIESLLAMIQNLTPKTDA